MRKPKFAYAKTKVQISFAVTAKLISACFRCRDSTIPLLSKSEISSVYPSSMTIQFVPVLFTNHIVGFLTRRLIYLAAETAKMGLVETKLAIIPGGGNSCQFMCQF